jgi:transposase-like protein
MTTIESPSLSTAKPPRTRCQWAPQERAEWVALFEKSGQTALEFCRDNDLAPATLSLWRAQLQGAAGDAEGAGELVEIPLATLSAPSAVSAAVTMRLPGGVQLQIVAGTDPAWLSALLRALMPGRS